MLRLAITDRTLLASDESSRREALLLQAARLASQGVDLLLLRERDLDANVLAALARELLAVLNAHAPDPARRTRLLIHSRADIALATGADGVHLPATPGLLKPAQIRALYADAGLPAPVVSVSCHSLAEVAEVAQAASSGARPQNQPDLIVFGPIMEKRVGDRLISDGIGLELLREACALAAPVPVLALGGITRQDEEACLKAGAAGVAGIRLFR